MDKIPFILNEYLTIENHFLINNITLYNDTLTYLDELFKLLVHIKKICYDVPGNRDDYQKVLLLILAAIEDSLSTSFSTFFRGSPKLALACFRPGVEGIGYIWHMHLDQTRKKVKVFIEGEGWHIDQDENLAKDERKEKAFYKAFKKQRFPKENSPNNCWAINELRDTWGNCSLFGSHSGSEALLVFYRSTLPELPEDTKYQAKLNDTYYSMLKMMRQIVAVLCEVYNKAFSSPEWEKIDYSILNTILKYIWLKYLEPKKMVLMKLIESTPEIQISDPQFHQTALNAIGINQYGLKERINQYAHKELVEWLRTYPWNETKRAQAVISIIQDGVIFEEEPGKRSFKPTGSPFLDPFKE